MSRRAPRHLRALAIVALALAVAGPSAAWEQTQSQQGLPLAWPGSCYHYSLNEAGSDDFAFDELEQLVADAFDTWSAVECSYFRFEATPPASVDEQVFNDDKGNVNLLVWRETDDEWPYSPAVIALTSVHYDPATGEIRDVDIEFNGWDFAFAAADAYPDGTALVDLPSTVTHEIGHTLGLDHSDDLTATMAPYADPGSVFKRTLAADDIDGLCAIYPLGDDPDECAEPLCGLDLTGDSTVCELVGPAAQEQDCGCDAVGAGPATGSWRGWTRFWVALLRAGR